MGKNRVPSLKKKMTLIILTSINDTDGWGEKEFWYCPQLLPKNAWPLENSAFPRSVGKVR
jgi:hypothetical protein